MPILRVLTYNVRSLRDDAAAVARVIASARPHVVCVQEAPRFVRWRSAAAALARRSGLVVLAGGRTAAGNLLLCDLAVDVVHTVDIVFSSRPDADRTHRPGTPRLGTPRLGTPRLGTPRRGAAVAICALAGERFAVAGTHLDLSPRDRQLHAHELLDRLPEVGAGPDLPTIVAGDINDEPGSATWQVLTERLTDAGAAGPTFPAIVPTRRIDGIFVDPRLPVRNVEVLDGDDVRVGSDHRPVLAMIELGAHRPRPAT